MSENNNDAAKNPKVDYERQDLNIRSLVIFGVGLLLVTIVAMVLIAVILNTLNTRRAAVETSPPTEFPTPAAPRLQPNPIDQTTAIEELEELRAREDAMLNSYDWVDREAGVVRIPIERAMELVVEENQ
jgi:hypothetical protein